MKAELGHVYIANIRGDIQKIKILELTKTSIKFLFMDSDSQKRLLVTDFERRFTLLEDLGDPEFDSLKAQLKF